MNYKILVFDFFGVICSEVASFWLAKHLSDYDAIKIKKTVVDAADRGKMTQAELFSALGKLAHRDPALIEQDWLEHVHINEEVLTHVRELKRQHPLGLLTNAPSPFVRGILRRSNLEGLFDAVVVSSEIGYAKPDREAYDKILSDLSIPAMDALMIDDNPVNVEGAIAAGMGGLLFQSSRQLKTDLT